MEFNSLLDLLMKGGFTILILLICSILSLKVIIEKLILFKALKERYIYDYSSKINRLILKNNMEEAVEELELITVPSFGLKIKSALRTIFKFILTDNEKSKEELVEQSYIKLDIQLVRLEKGLNILATLGSISPFIGLFGTVIGIIKSFEALSNTVSFSYSNVMAGIAEALISTAAGLLVAVPSVMFYNHFSKRIKSSLPFFDEAINTTVSNVVKMRGQKYEKV
ncbi:MAG TPA: MotA/TolQ/ExbB proton channel family protein [Ignavibacteriaceae bacterium]|nr:MotA/TolQ/ExbB proton channel family protein [Ignavibacteriaceae bacterium]